MRYLCPFIQNYFLTFILTISCHIAFTQSVGINNDGSSPDASAMLDVQSNNSGVLIPRLTTSQRTGITGPATGLIVFDITTESFWFYAGSSWIEVLSGFVTMISDADHDTKIEVEKSYDEDTVRITTNGVEHFNLAAGRIGVLNTGQSVFLGEGAGKNDDLTYNWNAAIGFNALYSNTSGSNNIALGYKSLFQNITGFGNVAIGSSSLNDNTGGFHNIGIGNFALKLNVNGNNNLAIGTSSLHDNI